MTQRYLFTHVMLPGLYWSDRPRLRQILEGIGGTAFLHRLWAHAGQHIAQRDPNSLQSAQGLSLESKPGLSIVTLPAPVEAPDAFFVALQWDEKPACTTLELGDDGATFLCGWEDTTHVNYGPGPIPELAAFLEALPSR